jgi:hypothetical protein
MVSVDDKMGRRTKGIKKMLEIIEKEMECKGPTMDCRIKIHVFINFKAKNKDFYLLCYMVSN